MTVLIALATWLGGAFLLALLLGAFLSFSEQNEAAELDILFNWQMTRMGSHEVTRAPLPEGRAKRSLARAGPRAGEFGASDARGGAILARE
jgi:hypothetical protein